MLLRTESSLSLSPQEIAALRERVTRAQARADRAALAQTAALFEHEADAKARLAEVAAAEARMAEMQARCVEEKRSRR